MQYLRRLVNLGSQAEILVCPVCRQSLWMSTFVQSLETTWPGNHKKNRYRMAIFLGNEWADLCTLGGGFAGSEACLWGWFYKYENLRGSITYLSQPTIYGDNANWANRTVQTCRERALRMFHLNVRSINKKYEELQMVLNSTGITFVVAMVTEILCTNNSNSFATTYYDSFVLNRTRRRGVGVAMKVKSGINASLIESFTIKSNYYEILALPSGTYVFWACYSPDANVV